MRDNTVSPPIDDRRWPDVIKWEEIRKDVRGDSVLRRIAAVYRLL